MQRSCSLTARVYRRRHDWIASENFACGNRTWKRGQNWPHKWPLRRERKGKREKKQEKQREIERERKVYVFHFLAVEDHSGARFSSSGPKGEWQRGGDTKDSLKLLLSTCRRSGSRTNRLLLSHFVECNGSSISGDHGRWSMMYRADPNRAVIQIDAVVSSVSRTYPRVTVLYEPNINIRLRSITVLVRKMLWKDILRYTFFIIKK